MILVDYFCAACDSDQEHMVDAPAPDFVECEFCSEQAQWVPSAIIGRVRRVEAVRGKWEKPERPTYLDTHDLGEGQSVEEFQAKRRKVWRDHRMTKAYQEFKNK